MSLTDPDVSIRNIQAIPLRDVQKLSTKMRGNYHVYSHNTRNS